MSNEQDIALVRDCLEGDTRAFERLVDKYQKVLYNIALRMLGEYDDACEVTQAVFVKAYESLKTFDPKYKFFSWIYRMTVNESLNVISRRRPEVPISDDLRSRAPAPDENIAQDQLAEVIQMAVARLPIEYRVILVLRHFAGLSYEELSFVLEIPAKTVKSRLFTARRRLADVLEKWGISAHG